MTSPGHPRMQRRLLPALAGLSAALLAGPATAREERRMDAMNREYFLYTPDTIDTGKVYRLLVGIHHYKATGVNAYGLAGMVKERDCIAVGPTFPSEGYQILAKESDRQLIGIYETLRREFPLHPKMILYGFSGGAQFAHRLALKYPDLVAACAAHSGGSWDLGEQYGNAAARKVLFVVSCGADDNGKAGPGAPYGRADYCRKFVERLQGAGFYFKSGIWPGEGHGASGGSWTLTHELWRLVFTGLHDSERERLEKAFQAAEAWIACGKRSEARKALDGIELEFAPRADPPSAAAPASIDGWRVNPDLRESLRKEAWEGWIAPRLSRTRARL
jgi:pimeloyl-ACP methyl ester carboxylesterase